MSARRSPFGAERLVRATAWRFTFLALQGGASVVLFAVLGHALPTRVFAATAVAQGVLVIAQVIGDFGLAQAAVTVLPSRIAADPGSAPRLLAGASQAYLGAAAAALLLTLASVALVPGAAQLPVAVCAPAAAATVLVGGADGLLRSQGEFRRPVWLMAASEAGGFAGIPVALATHSALWTCVGISAGTTLGAAGAVAELIRLHSGGPGGTARPFARAAVPIGLAQVFIVLGSRVDTLLAGAISGLVAAGTFEGAWRTYQLAQYAVGALATAAAPFVADALGSGQPEAAVRLMRQLLGRLLFVGIVAGVVLYVARRPIADVLAGSLAGPVARGLPALAAVSPITAAGLVAFYTLIGRDGERRYVLGCIALGAVVNLALAAALAPSMHARGVLIGCAIGLAATNLLLLARLGLMVRTLRQSTLNRSAASVSGSA